jgi:hypothetical protein
VILSVIQRLSNPSSSTYGKLLKLVEIKMIRPRRVSWGVLNEGGVIIKMILRETGWSVM